MHETAARWVARLQADDCSVQDRTACQAWLDEHPSHKQAFYLVQAVWKHSSVVPASPVMASPIAHRRMTRRGLVAGLAAGIGVLALAPRKTEASVVSTSIGQKINLSVRKGVDLLIDSDSSVGLAPRNTCIDLYYGQIEIKMAQQAAAFATEMGTCHLLSQEGHFNVRHMEDSRTITVLDGVATLHTGPQHPAYRLAAGQRATITPGDAVVIDTPRLDDIMAWRTGRLSFRDTPLSTVVAEMNRYSTQKIILNGNSTGDLRVSGYYHFGNNENFSRVLEKILPVHAVIGPSITIMKVS
ncbi:DUF4880 domain-containing protein [Komagataeibacter sp. FXV3]|uniref:FecR family protein n=1 Tax=Komagataeibacter sp. FXV3 TaxID=2608998 RepID=UPI00187B3BB7|nr:DUF4880 domain-containing protein [Komagataeibacter sp. FXV3]